MSTSKNLNILIYVALSSTPGVRELLYCVALNSLCYHRARDDTLFVNRCTVKIDTTSLANGQFVDVRNDTEKGK